MLYPIKCHHGYIIGDFQYMLKLRWYLPLIELSIDHTTNSGTLLFSPLELVEAIYKYRI